MEIERKWNLQMEDTVRKIPGPNVYRFHCIYCAVLVLSRMDLVEVDDAVS